MQFLSDVYIRCPDCNGRRYRPHILEVKLRAALPDQKVSEWSIADMLEATVDTAILLLVNFIDRPAARRAVGRLKLLQDVGLGYAPATFVRNGWIVTIGSFVLTALVWACVFAQRGGA